MAKYTELLSEYIAEGGQLPALFDEITGFSDLFIGEYADREIGFETPTLFQLKLEYKAQLVIPTYKQRISDLEASRELILNPNKKRVKTGNLTRSRNGEIIHTEGATDETTTNTKAGTIQVKDIGNDMTAYPDEDSNIEKTIVYEQPFAVINDPPALTQPGTVTEVTKPTLQTSKSNTQTTSYTGYTDTTHQISEATTNKESYNDYSEVENYNEITDTESGFSSSEALAIAQHFDEEASNILAELLAEFDTLFMGIF